MMGLGGQELAIVLVIVVVIFGAGKLPELGRGLGQGIKEFKLATSDGNGAAPVAATTGRKDERMIVSPLDIRADQI